MQPIKRWLAPPNFPDDELKTRRASLLNAGLIAVMALSVVLVAGDLLGGLTPVAAIILNGVAFAVCLVFRHWMHQGRVGLASVGLVALATIGITAGIVELGTIRTPTTAGYLVLIVGAGLLFDLGGIITAAALSSLLLLGLVWAENAGLLPHPDFSVTITQWVTFTAFFGFTGGLTWFGLQSARQALRHADAELAERKRMEEALRRYELMARHSRDIILFLRLDDGRILEANAAATHAYGYTREELLSMTIRDLRAPETQALVADQMAKANAQGILFETAHRHKDGHAFPVEVSSQGVSIGGTRTLISVIRDITGRKEVEAELAMLARFPGENPNPILRLDSDGLILYANGMAAPLLKEWQCEVGSPAPASWRALVAEALASRQSRTLEVRFQEKVYSLVVTPIPDASYVNLYGNEITQRQRAEEELARANEQLKDRVSQLERHQRESVMLNEMGDALQSCLSVQEIYGVIAEFSAKLFPHECGALYIIAESRNAAQSVATWGDPAAGILEPTFAPDECWALRRGRMHTVQYDSPGMVCQHVKRQYTDGALPSALCVPMFVQSEVLGLFHLQSAGERISNQKEHLAIAVTERLAPTHASLRLRETLRQQAIRDSLTGLFNRRYMVESLERELHRATRRGTQISVILLDLDHFKDLNDLYGHPVGDAMLRALGHLLATRVRKEDIVCRYGGEEFLIILPDTPRAEAQTRAEQLRQEIQNLHTEHLGVSYRNLTASFGLAVFPEHGTTAETLLRAADAALYQAKLAGRNRVMTAP